MVPRNTYSFASRETHSEIVCIPNENGAEYSLSISIEIPRGINKIVIVIRLVFLFHFSQYQVIRLVVAKILSDSLEIPSEFCRQAIR